MQGGCVFWVPRRVCGRSQAERAGGVQPDETAPQQQRFGLTPPDRSASVRRRRGEGPRTLRNHKQRPPANNATRPRAQRMLLEKPNRRGPPPHSPTRRPPSLWCPPEALLLTSGAHQTRQTAARPNACAVTRTDARSCPITTASRQRDQQHFTELRHPRGHQTVREAVRNACKPQTNRTHLPQRTPSTQLDPAQPSPALPSPTQPGFAQPDPARLCPARPSNPPPISHKPRSSPPRTYPPPIAR
jgi:hypothetical protein